MANSKLMSKKNKMIILKLALEKVQRTLSLGKKLTISDIEELEHQENDFCGEVLPKDVKDGHFAVVAKDGVSAKRFLVPLRYLTHPMFLTLLEKAAEEYGFDHGGALTIPCNPSEIERILSQRWDGNTILNHSNERVISGNNRRNSNYMLQSY
ncbi:unnamed protein product [Amaranthus hypochondriacus]